MAIEITALANVSRETLADGVWFTDKIIGVADQDLQNIAQALDDNDIANLPNVIASAKLGASAWNAVKNQDFAKMSANAVSGASAWMNVSAFDYDGVSRSAYSGFKAAEKTLPYDITTIKEQAKLGYVAYQDCSAYNLSAIQNSAKSARGAYNNISANTSTINNLISTCSAFSSISAFGPVTIWYLNENSARWNETTANLSLYETAYDALLPYEKWREDPTKRYNEMTAFWNNVQLKFGRLQTSLGEISADANNMHNVISAYSARWNRMDSGQRSGYGASAWNQLPGETATFWHLSSVSAKSANWTWAHDKTNQSATKFTSAANIISTNRNKWLLPSAFNTYTNFVTSYRKNSEIYNRAFYSGASSLSALSGWADTCKSDVDASASKWNSITVNPDWTATYGKVNANSANWQRYWTSADNMSSCVTVFSSHSGTQTSPMWEQMAYGKSDWWGKIGSWTGIVGSNSSYWLDLSAVRRGLTGNPSYSAALTVTNAKTITSTSANFSAWYTLYDYNGGKAEALTEMYKTYTANSASKWLKTNGTNASLRILRRKGWFTKYHTGTSEIANTIFLMS